MLADRLGGKRVLVIAAGADAGTVDGVAGMLRVARASVAGPVTLTDRFVDPLRSQELLDTALTSLPQRRVRAPATTDGVTASAALLAAVLLTRTPAVTADDRRSVLAAYADLGYLAGVDAAGEPADAVVVVGGGAGGGHPGAAAHAGRVRPGRPARGGQRGGGRAGTS